MKKKRNKQKRKRWYVVYIVVLQLIQCSVISKLIIEPLPTNLVEQNNIEKVNKTNNKNKMNMKKDKVKQI